MDAAATSLGPAEQHTQTAIAPGGVVDPQILRPSAANDSPCPAVQHGTQLAAWHFIAVAFKNTGRAKTANWKRALPIPVSRTSLPVPEADRAGLGLTTPTIHYRWAGSGSCPIIVPSKVPDHHRTASRHNDIGPWWSTIVSTGSSTGWAQGFLVSPISRHHGSGLGPVRSQRSNLPAVSEQAQRDPASSQRLSRIQTVAELPKPLRLPRDNP
ncbi:hypothetical protein VTI28DRAFT_952 [Corynascus sepedonium]